MDAFVLGARVLLAAVFATAGAAKLLDRAGSRKALMDFGVPARAAPILAMLLPLAELGSAAALLLRPSARWGALAALVLLVAFIAGIVRALSRGQTPDCHCFGQLHSAPAGRGTLARNALLALLAALVALRGPGPTIDGWVAARTAAELVAVGASVAAALLAAVALRLWLDNRRLRRDSARGHSHAVSPLPVGAPAPGFSLLDLHGQKVTLESLLARGCPLALVFISPTCGPCQTLLPDLGRWQTVLANDLTVAVVSGGSSEENRPAAEEHGVSQVLLQQKWEVMEAYGVEATPAAVIVSADGTVASAPAEGAFTIEPLVRLTLRRGLRSPPSSAAAAELPAT
ncbi:MAG: peroxiredoxin family protein [Actinobacteria bacterium]|nr:peroxiredoxin family protein [Actinomycetota bacterium]